MVKLMNKALRPLGLDVHLILEGKRFWGWTYPRFWLHQTKGHRTLLHIEFSAWSRFCCFQLETDHDQELGFNIAFPPFSLWVSVPLARRIEQFFQQLARVKQYDLVYIAAVRVHDWTLHWNFLSDSQGWTSTTPRWRDGHFDLVRFFLGRDHMETEVLSEHDVEIPMPEGVYNWHINLQRRTFWRARWPFKRVRLGYEAKPLDGEHIPFPGKGTMSYNCGSDGLYGQSSSTGRTVEAAIASVVQSVLESRKRYGGGHRYITDGKYDPNRPILVRDPEQSGNPAPVAEA